MSDDLEDYWNDVVPPRTKSEEQPITLGCLWLGALGPRHEESLDRLLVRVPDGQTLEFQAEFPISKTTQVSGGALWLAKHGCKPVYAKPFQDVRDLSPGDSITLKIVIADSGNEYVSFRKLLQLYGVL